MVRAKNCIPLKKKIHHFIKKGTFSMNWKAKSVPKRIQRADRCVPHHKNMLSEIDISSLLKTCKYSDANNDSFILNNDSVMEVTETPIYWQKTLKGIEKKIHGFQRNRCISKTATKYGKRIVKKSAHSKQKIKEIKTKKEGLKVKKKDSSAPASKKIKNIAKEDSDIAESEKEEDGHQLLTSGLNFESDENTGKLRYSKNAKQSKKKRSKVINPSMMQKNSYATKENKTASDNPPSSTDSVCEKHVTPDPKLEHANIPMYKEIRSTLSRSNKKQPKSIKSTKSSLRPVINSPAKQAAIIKRLKNGKSRIPDNKKKTISKPFFKSKGRSAIAQKQKMTKMSVKATGKGDAFSKVPTLNRKIKWGRKNTSVKAKNVKNSKRLRKPKEEMHVYLTKKKANKGIKLTGSSKKLAVRKSRKRKSSRKKSKKSKSKKLKK